MLVKVAVTRLTGAARSCGVMVAVLDGEDSGDERRRIYPRYKQQRDTDAAPDPMLVRLKAVATNIFQKAGFKVARSTGGYEGDDVIAVFSASALADPASRVWIASDDKDMLALLTDARVRILRHSSKGGHIEECSVSCVPGKFKVAAAQMTDFLAICGDASDNIPGAEAIGEMRASALLREYGDSAGIIRAASDGELRGPLLKAFIDPESLRRIEISRELVRLRLEATWEAL
jgi:DNA polymerase-1